MNCICKWKSRTRKRWGSHEYTTARERIKATLVKRLEDMELDGSPASTEKVLATVRLIQSEALLHRLMHRMIDHGHLKDADLERKKRWRLGGVS